MLWVFVQVGKAGLLLASRKLRSYFQAHRLRCWLISPKDRFYNDIKLSRECWWNIEQVYMKYHIILGEQSKAKHWSISLLSSPLEMMGRGSLEMECSMEVIHRWSVQWTLLEGRSGFGILEERSVCYALKLGFPQRTMEPNMKCWSWNSRYWKNWKSKLCIYIVTLNWWSVR